MKKKKLLCKYKELESQNQSLKSEVNSLTASYSELTSEVDLLRLQVEELGTFKVNADECIVDLKDLKNLEFQVEDLLRRITYSYQCLERAKESEAKLTLWQILRDNHIFLPI